MAISFSASEFTATEWSSPEDKAAFANHFIVFVKSDFKRTLFPKWFYKRLSICFGMIAHYNIDGFYATYFDSREGKINFIRQCLSYPAYGDPKFTYSDVEKVLHKWLEDHAILDKLKAEE